MVQAVHQKFKSGVASDQDIAFMKNVGQRKGKERKNQGCKYNHPLPCLETQFFSIGLLVLPILQVSLIWSEPRICWWKLLLKEKKKKVI